MVKKSSPTKTYTRKSIVPSDGQLQGLPVQESQPGITAADFWESEWSSVGQTAPYKEFLESDSKDDVFTLRGVISDEFHVIAYAKALSRYEEFHDTLHIRMLKNLIMGNAMIKGRARFEAVSAATGTISDVALATLLGASEFKIKYTNKGKNGKNKDDQDDKDES